MRHIATVCALVVIMSIPTAAQNRAADEAAIRGRIQTLVAAMKRHDAAAYAAIYTEDADEIILQGPRLVGRAAIQAANAKAWAAAPNNRVESIEPLDFRFVGADIAIVNTLARFTDGATRTEDRGTWFMRRQNGIWMLIALRVFPPAKPS